MKDGSDRSDLTDSDEKLTERGHDDDDDDRADGGGVLGNDNRNNAGEDPSAPTTPLPSRTESQLSQSQMSDMEGTAASRRSSAGRPSSTKSGLSRNPSATSFVTVSSAGRKSRAKSCASPETPDIHQVTFTVTISAAVPAVFDDVGDKNKVKKVVSDPKPQAFYHIEYFLLPTDVDPNKTDITLFGIAAKIYPDKQEPKVMKTWTEGNKTWIAWSQSHTINVTSDMLKKLCYHKVVVRIWDTRDKYGPKARYDRPRAFRLPTPKPGDDGDDIRGVKTFLARLCRAYARRLPKNSRERALPQPISEARMRGKFADPDFAASSGPAGAANPIIIQDAGEVPCLLLGHPDMEYRVYSKLLDLAKLERQHLDKKMLRKNLDTTRRSPVNDPSVGDLNQGEAGKGQLPPQSDQLTTQKSGTPGSRARRVYRDKKAEQVAKEAAEYAKKHGVCSIHVPVGPLFVGQRMCISRLETPVKSVLDAFVSVSIDKELLTPEFTRELNPMSINIKSVKNLPNEPVDYYTLSQMCHPCSLSYDFFQHNTHKTKAIPQGKNLHWDDLNVVLLGPLARSQLIEYLLGPPMEIKVHDRDKLPGTSQLKPALFGHDGEDEKINNVGYISGKRTQYNALKDRPTSWDPYGVAKVDMADLLLGQKVINVQVPVHSCGLPDILGRQAETGKVMGMPGSVDGPSEPPMAPGVYMDSHTMVKVRLEVAVPLVTPREVATKPYLPPTVECPFARIVYVLDQKKGGMAKPLLSLTSQINAKGLGLDSLSPVVLDAALSTYKLSVEQQTRTDLDIVTGFQLLDGRHHLFVLEGLADGAIQHIWHKMRKHEQQVAQVFQPKTPNSHLEGVKVLYNSDMTYGRRLYGALDVDLTRVKLHQPMEMIVQQPLLFVRDMVPRSCFVSLTKLDQLINCNDLRSASRNDLFPTSDEIISMSREFGVPLTAEDLITDAEQSALAGELKEQSKSAVPLNATARVSRSRMQLKEPLDMSNERYLEALKSRQMTADGINYLSDNMRTVMLESRQNKLRKHYPPVQHSSQRVAQNYSTSTYNSTELAKDIIRQNLDKDTLYTYNPAYHHSATFVPVNIEELKKKEQLEHRKRFLTRKGWNFPEVKTLQQCNEHPKKPDPAKVDSLKEEWIENQNHRNKLNPTLEDREVYSWIDRKLDMNTWKYPAKHFEPSPEPPISIILPGKQLQGELSEAARKDADVWQAKVVVDDPTMHFYRCNPQTEAISRGPKASNQLSKLENILRDPPQKHAFAAPRMRTDIPPLRVVHYPSVDVKARCQGIDVGTVTAQMMKDEAQVGAFKPGPYEDRSWSMETNRVPAITYNHADNGYFNLYHNSEHTNTNYKRHISPLHEAEYKSTYLFADPEKADASRQRHTVLQVPETTAS